MIDYKEKILSYRAKHLLTQVQFAKTCGIAKNVIAKIEQGKAKKMSYKTIGKLNKILEVD